MCGIAGYIGNQEVTSVLLKSLRMMEYRGYDSAGIATLVDGAIYRRRTEGKLINLASSLKESPLSGTMGIGHTRWATHGAPTEANAHPHGTALVNVVHNGIIENHAELRAELRNNGYTEDDFTSETDTMVVALLIDYYLFNHNMKPFEAAQAAFKRLEGAYALVVMFSNSEHIICKQHGAPLAIGYGRDEMFIGSDALALAPHTQQLSYLKEGDWAVVQRTGAMIFDERGNSVTRDIIISRHTADATSKGYFRHFMEKELHDHPAAIGDTLRSLVNASTHEVDMPQLGIDFKNVSRITITSCGTSFYAGLLGRWWFESIARMPTDVDFASEFRYRAPPISERGLGILVSQSGETADTLAALRYMKSQDQMILSIVNVAESTIARASDAILQSMAGPEIGVASTKAFTAQLTAFACLALKAGHERGTIDEARGAAMLKELQQLPAQVGQVLEMEAQIIDIARHIQMSRDVLYLGRGGMYPIAMEGALKLKEISYIHAEGYAAGEMKHGPIALIDPEVPVIVLCPSDALFEKTASNLQEAAARGAQIIALTDREGADKLRLIKTKQQMQIITLPVVSEFAAPILYAVPVQMLAYHVAALKGTDVDQPRNLAKSVTVE